VTGGGHLDFEVAAQNSVMLKGHLIEVPEIAPVLLIVVTPLAT